MFKPNLEKLKWCMVWVLNHQHCTPAHLCEIIFQAEIDHLNQHARPITGVTYYKGSPIYCLEIEKLYAELNPILKPLPSVNTHHMSISDIDCLRESLNKTFSPNTYIQELIPNSEIKYKSLVFDLDILEYLEENDSFSIVI